MKNLNQKMISILAIIFTILPGTIGQNAIPKPPVNTAAVMGSDVRFNVTATYSGTEAFVWRFESHNIYNSQTGITAGDEQDYDVIEYDDNYDLIVMNVDQNDAGVYTATFALDTNPLEQAHLVVLENWVCQQPSDPVRREEQTIDFRCEVTYTGYKAPMLQWRDENGLVLESEYEADDANPNRVVLFYNKTAEPSDHEQEYTCHLWFQQDEGEAEEAPVLTDHCSITYWIEHHPTEIEMYPEYNGSPLTMNEGDHINCTSNGYPNVDYEWWCNGAPYSSGQVMVVEGDLLKDGSDLNTCNCSALNSIDGGNRLGASREIKFYAYADDNGGSGGSTLSAGAIAACVIVPLVVIVVAVVLGIVFIRRRDKGGADSMPPKKTPPQQMQPVSRPPPTSSQPGYRAVDPKSGPGGPGPYGGQPGYTGHASSGQADLGMRSLSGSVPGLNQSFESLHSQNSSQQISRMPTGSAV